MPPGEALLLIPRSLVSSRVRSPPRSLPCSPILWCNLQSLEPLLCLQGRSSPFRLRQKRISSSPSSGPAPGVKVFLTELRKGFKCSSE